MEKDIIKKVEKYEAITKKGLDKIKKKTKLTEKENRIANEFLSMAKNYFEDGKYFKNKKDYFTALASFSYAHAWLDAGVKSRIFEAEDDQLFTLP